METNQYRLYRKLYEEGPIDMEELSEREKGLSRMLINRGLIRRILPDGKVDLNSTSRQEYELERTRIGPFRRFFYNLPHIG